MITFSGGEKSKKLKKGWKYGAGAGLLKKDILYNICYIYAMYILRYISIYIYTRYILYI